MQICKEKKYKKHKKYKKNELMGSIVLYCICVIYKECFIINKNNKILINYELVYHWIFRQSYFCGELLDCDKSGSLFSHMY